jgi:hypothetical protein
MHTNFSLEKPFGRSGHKLKGNNGSSRNGGRMQTDVISLRIGRTGRPLVRDLQVL